MDRSIDPLVSRHALHQNIARAQRIPGGTECVGATPAGAPVDAYAAALRRWGPVKQLSLRLPSRTVQ